MSEIVRYTIEFDGDKPDRFWYAAEVNEADMFKAMIVNEIAASFVRKAMGCVGRTAGLAVNDEGALAKYLEFLGDGLMHRDETHFVPQAPFDRYLEQRMKDQEFAEQYNEARRAIDGQQKGDDDG